jgi:Ca2+-binding RTX toxin-like protein
MTALLRARRGGGETGAAGLSDGRVAIRRIAVVAVVASTLSVGFASAARADVANAVWVDANLGLVIEYRAPSPASNLVVSNAGATITVEDSVNLTAGPGCSPTGVPTVVTCISTTTYRITTGPGDDSVEVRLTGVHAADRGTISVGAGDDRVLGGRGPSWIYGGAGTDALHAPGDDSYIDGGSGADRMDAGGTAAYITVTYASSPAGVVADPDGAGADDGAPGEGDTIGSDVDALIGSPFDDVLTGTAGANTIIGCAGNDQLSGLGGDDRLTGDGIECGGGSPVGADRIDGGAGFDSVFYDDRVTAVMVTLDSSGPDGQAGERDSVVEVEFVYGGFGDDVIVGNDNANRLSGGSGNDIMLGGDGADVLIGGDGDDSLFGNYGADRLMGDAGSDLCDVGPEGLSVITCER